MEMKIKRIIEDENRESLLKSLKVVELKKVAKELEIPKYSSMKKDNLVQEIINKVKALIELQNKSKVSQEKSFNSPIKRRKPKDMKKKNELLNSLWKGTKVVINVQGTMVRAEVESLNSDSSVVCSCLNGIKHTTTKDKISFVVRSGSKYPKWSV
jgi:preprotein translocase subunit YajC